MDVLKVQKMNALASELRKHNFASSSDTAFQQAEQVFVEREKPVVEDSSIVVQRSDRLAERRFELLLESASKKYEQELSVLRSAINVLSNELESLKSEMRKFSEVRVVEKPKERQVELKPEVKEPHPRQGSYSPGDVDMQKMFYFGNKR